MLSEPLCNGDIRGPVGIAGKGESVRWPQRQSEIRLTRVENARSVSLFVLDVGVCPRARRSRCRALQVGPPGHLYP